jgi:DNA-binding IclR family transcriptional regulator
MSYPSGHTMTRMFNLARIMKHADDDERKNLTAAQLAGRAGCSYSQCLRALSYMQSAGWVIWHKHLGWILTLWGRTAIHWENNAYFTTCFDVDRELALEGISE